jgi:hypothetical protein
MRRPGTPSARSARSTQSDSVGAFEPAGPSSTRNWPPGKDSAALRAAAIATVVLPMPPRPATTRAGGPSDACRDAASRSTSSVRPTKVGLRWGRPVSGCRSGSPGASASSSPPASTAWSQISARDRLTGARPVSILLRYPLLKWVSAANCASDSPAASRHRRRCAPNSDMNQWSHDRVTTSSSRDATWRRIRPDLVRGSAGPAGINPL